MDPKAKHFSPRAISADPSTSYQISAPQSQPLSSSQVAAPSHQPLSYSQVAASSHQPLSYSQVTTPPPRPFHQDSALLHSFVNTERIQHPVSNEQANQIYRNHQRMNSALLGPQTTYSDLMNERGQSLGPQTTYSELMNERGQSAAQSLPGPSSFTSHQGSTSVSSTQGTTLSTLPKVHRRRLRANALNSQFNQGPRHDVTNQLTGLSTPARANEASNIVAMMANESPMLGRATFPTQFSPGASAPTMCSNWLLYGRCDGSDGCPTPKGPDKNRKLEVIEEVSGEFIGSRY